MCNSTGFKLQTQIQTGFKRLQTGFQTEFKRFKLGSTNIHKGSVRFKNYPLSLFKLLILNDLEEERSKNCGIETKKNCFFMRRKLNENLIKGLRLRTELKCTRNSVKTLFFHSQNLIFFG